MTKPVLGLSSPPTTVSHGDHKHGPLHTPQPAVLPLLVTVLLSLHILRYVLIYANHAPFPSPLHYSWWIMLIIFLSMYVISYIKCKVYHKVIRGVQNIYIKHIYWLWYGWETSMQNILPVVKEVNLYLFSFFWHAKSCTYSICTTWLSFEINIHYWNHHHTLCHRHIQDLPTFPMTLFSFCVFAFSYKNT